MSHDITFLPQPQEALWGAGRFDLGAGLALRVDERAWPRLKAALADLAAGLKTVGVRVTYAACPAGAAAVLTVTCGDAADVAPAELPEAEEGYLLRITAGGLALAARSAHGLFNGLQTLRQAATQCGGALPAGTIRDWPALALRGIHLDLKGSMAPASYWQEAIRLLSQFKINAVLIEYEDKFPFAAHPEVVGPGALTRTELDELLATARDCFVEVIPLLQSLGHVEWILRAPQHTHLCESGSLSQFCPQKEGAWLLLAELLDEMIAAHPDARHFHLGADEAWLLGDCPACREVVARESKLALYLGFVNRAIERVQAAGLRPIIWDDMIQRNLEGGGLDLLPEGVVLCNWAYGPRETGSPIFYYGGPEGHARFRWASRQWLTRDPGVLDPQVRWLEEAPDDVLAFAREYWDRGEYPLSGASLPWIRYFRKHGRAVIGASAAKGANGFHVFSPMFDHRIDNVATWGRAAREDGAEGVIATAWARYNGLTVPCEPFELGWHPYLGAAAYCWESRDPQREALDGQFLACYLASRDAQFALAVEWLDRGKRTGNDMLLSRAADVFAQTRSDTLHGRRYLAHLALAARLARLQVAADRLLGDAWAEHGRAIGGTLSAEHRVRYRDGADRLLAEFAAWQEGAAQVLATSLKARDVEEAIATQTAGYARRLSDLRTMMEETPPFEGDRP